MQPDHTPRDRVLTWLPVAILAACLLIAAAGLFFGSAVLGQAPFGGPTATPVPTLHEYSASAPADSAQADASASTDFDAAGVPPPDFAVLDNVAHRICAVTDGCLSIVVQRASAGHWHGRPAWGVAFHYAFRDGFQTTALDWVDAQSGAPLEMANVAR